MEEKLLLGIDLGVTLVKVGIYDISGNCIDITTKESTSNYPETGVFLQSGDDFLKIVITSVKESIRKSGIKASSIEGIAFSGQMGGAIGVDKDWNAVTYWSNPLDTRYIPYVTKMLEAAGNQILKLSGTNFPYFAPKVLWWKNEFPDLYRRISKFMVLSGFIAGKMGDFTTEDAFIDQTYLQMTGIADIPNNKWSDEICNEFGIKKELLPRIVSSSTIVGNLGKRAARECGLKDGIPLIAGAGDKPAGYLAAGVVVPGLLIDESASFAAFSLCIDKYISDIKNKTLENIPSPIRGHYYPTIILIGSGTTNAWFKNVFGDEEKRIALETGKSPFEVLDERAKKIPPGSEGLLSIGLLGGRGYPSDPDIRGMWIGFSWSHKKEHFYRSLLESFAYEYGHALKVMRDNYPEIDIKEVRAIGGGSRSDLWNQIKSDVLGLTYARLNREDLTLLGDVLIAGKALGIYKDLAKVAQKFTGEIKRYFPNEKNHKFYKKYVDLYENIFDHVRNIYIDLKEIPKFG